MLSDWLLVALGVLLTAGTAVFVAGEFSLVTLDPGVVEAQATDDHAGHRVQRALHTLSTQLSGAQVGITATTILLGYTTQPAVGRLLADALRHPVPAGVATGLSVAIALVLATAVALVWANLAPEAYDTFWHTPVSIAVGDVSLELSLLHWINDGVMTVFFFLVSLEVKKEFVLGELHDWRHASVSVLMAAFGMLVPAVLFVLITWSSPYAGAWGW